MKKVNNRKHFHNVIKNEAPDDYILYRVPLEDINNNSTLIVGEGEVAVFVYEGKIINIFKTGSHILNTDNIPILSSN